MENKNFSLAIAKEKPIEIGTIIILSIAFPFLIHLIPFGGTPPLGAYLIPMFLAPFLTASNDRIYSGLAVAFLAPFVNFLITSHPSISFLTVITFELVIFFIAVLYYKKIKTIKIFTPVFAFLTAKALSSLFLVPFLLPIGIKSYFFSTLSTAIPGLIILFAINYFFLRNDKKISD